MQTSLKATLKLALLALAGACLLACGKDKPPRKSFIQIGEFAVKHLENGLTEVRDGAGRALVLVPRNAPPPSGYRTGQIVRVPVKRVVAYGYFDISTLRALGVLNTLVGVTHPADKWYIPEIRRAMEAGKIAYLGEASSIDFEKLKQMRPDLVLTWDYSAIAMLEELQIPCAITSTPVAMCLNARMRFVQFLAPFFGRQKQAGVFFKRVADALEDIRRRTATSRHQPKVMWGDIYEKRVLVEPGNAWVGELVGLAQSDYLFKDVYGTSCIEIALERFLYSGKEADIMFTYRTPATGATSKQALVRINPLLADVRPLKQGKVYAPRPHYVQSGDRLDEILTEIAAILHPDVYPGFKRRFFVELPDTDPPSAGTGKTTGQKTSRVAGGKS